MRALKLHKWDLQPREAIQIQQHLGSMINLTPLRKKIQFIGGTDLSFTKGSDRLWAGVVVLSFPDLAKVEERWIRGTVNFPYIPGLLSFRELPHIIRAIEMLKVLPDVIICDGQGIAHPRGVGIASHLGLLLGVPTIGCAKSKLIGEFQEPDFRKGSYSLIKHKERIIGAALRSKDFVKPIFISPGNMITLRESIDIVIRCCKHYRIPEPVRSAHILANRIRKKEGVV